MKTDYASNNNETRAHELLAPLVGACPDSVWDSISTELEARRLKAKNQWSNRINSIPRMPLMVAASVLIIAVSAWAFFNNKGSMQKSVVSTNLPMKPVAIKAASSNSNAVVQHTAVVQVSNVAPVKQSEVNVVQNDNEVAAKTEKHKNSDDATIKASAVQNIKPASDKTDEVITDIQASNTVSPANTHHGDSLSGKVVEQPTAESSSLADDEK